MLDTHRNGRSAQAQPPVTATSGPVSVTAHAGKATLILTFGVVEVDLAEAVHLFQALGPAVSACPQCGRAAVEGACPDPWQHRRDFGSSEATWWRNDGGRRG